jgi:hypothetical protein
LLSYLDVFDLFDVLERDWELFGHALIGQTVQCGRVSELRQIRHRIAHCRGPHPDDLGRIEQTLRDLEPGGLEAAVAFNDREIPGTDLDDPVVDGWIRRAHPDARRLIDHAESNYGISFRLGFSRRPWADSYREGKPVSRREGYFWHALFVLHSEGIEPRNLWNDHYLAKPSARDALVLVCIPRSRRPATHIQRYRRLLRLGHQREQDELGTWHPRGRPEPVAGPGRPP